MQNLPVLISYLGGCAGDLVTSSFNGIDLSFDHQVSVTADCTIKRQSYHDLSTARAELQKKPYRFVSTHEFDLFLNCEIEMISVEVTDEQIQNLCVLRQMQLQHLRIDVDDHSHWYLVVKKLCQAGKYEAAAAFWLEQARRLWLSRMQHRISQRCWVSGVMNFDQLFESSFADSIDCDAINVDPVILKNNHLRWLEKNQPSKWNTQSTVESMTQKLKLMDWTKTSGTVVYHA